MRAAKDARASPAQNGRHLIQMLNGYGTITQAAWLTDEANCLAASCATRRTYPEHASAPWERMHLTWHATSTLGRQGDART